MKEDFLYYVWQYKSFNTNVLKTFDNENLFIFHAGIRNRNSGPDFLNAKIRIGEQVWAGNIEMHVKSSDWYLHKHEQDVNYNAVILHVVWEHDVTIFLEGNQRLPTIELKDFVSTDLVKNYQSMLYTKHQWIPCQSEIASINAFVLENWKERLFFERLAQKSKLMAKQLQTSNNDFEQVMIHQLAKYFGSNTNADAFFQLFTSFDFSSLRKVRSNRIQIEALLFGQAGFLNEDLVDSYYLELKKEYAYLRSKFNLNPLSGKPFEFFGMRPNNFPTIRLAQLSALLFRHQHFFSKLMALEKLDHFYTFFSVDVHPFWKSHYTFSTKSKMTHKRLTKSFIDMLIINALIPLKILYHKHQGIPFQEIVLQIMQPIKTEKNAVIKKFLDLGVTCKNAMDSQALLELKKNYCDKRRCLECAIGMKVLKR